MRVNTNNVYLLCPVCLNVISLLYTYFLANSTGAWYLNVTVMVDCGLEESAGIMKSILPHFSVGSQAIVQCSVFRVIQVSLPTITLSSDEHGVRTWWPRGYGSQPLYDLTVSQLLSGCSKIVSSCQCKLISGIDVHGVYSRL